MINPVAAAVHLKPEDNVAIAAAHLAPNTNVPVRGANVKLLERIPMGHKLAVVPIGKGEAVRKFGQVIGFSLKQIEAGEHVHDHNLSCDDFERDYAFSTAIPPDLIASEERTFQGYDRGKGKVGTRNYIALISTVNCSATVCHQIASRFRDVSRRFPNIDGVIAITHKTGCGMSDSNLDIQHLRRTLAGYARHANVVAYVVIGLGCEVNEASQFVRVEQLTGEAGTLPPMLTIQGCGGISKTVAAGIDIVDGMLAKANDVRRTTQPASKLLLGTNCGGSDGNSGITANPALGVASDLLVAQGGTVILAETTEMYGAEHLLTRRAVTPAVGQKLIDRIRWWEWYASVFQATINNNPSQGNKQGGLSTIYEKSLGAIAKAGSSALREVYEYAVPITSRGFVIMDTPGFDPPSVTGIVAGGANVVVFTTGRGSVFGCVPTPSMKIATNTPLYEHMTDDMDLDAGRILTGTSVEQVGKEIFEMILSVASGTKTKSEQAGVGEAEFCPWMIGPVL